MINYTYIHLLTALALGLSTAIIPFIFVGDFEFYVWDEFFMLATTKAFIVLCLAVAYRLFIYFLPNFTHETQQKLGSGLILVCILAYYYLNLTNVSSALHSQFQSIYIKQLISGLVVASVIAHIMTFR
jgi:hypothetical protein